MRFRVCFPTLSTLIIVSHLGCGGRTATDTAPSVAGSNGVQGSMPASGGGNAEQAPPSGGASTIGSGTTAASAGGVTTMGSTSTGGGPDLSTYCNGLFYDAAKGHAYALEVNAIELLLVLDNSGSMSEPPAPADQASKWEYLSSVIGSVALEPYQNRVGFGLELFPYLAERKEDQFSNDISVMCSTPQDASAIAIPITKSSDSVTQIANFMVTRPPYGGRPTAAALQQAYAYFATGAGSGLPGRRFVLLVTNGGPNCSINGQCTLDACTQNIDGKCGNGPGASVNCCDGYGYICLDDEASVSVVSDLASIGVWTLVVGLPASEPYAETLKRLALAGKPPQMSSENIPSYFVVSSENAKEEFLSKLALATSIAAQPCDIPLPQVQPDPKHRNLVAVDCTLTPEVPTGTSTDAGLDGFYFDYDGSTAVLHLRGTACSPAVQAGSVNVDVVVGGGSIN